MSPFHFVWAPTPEELYILNRGGGVVVEVIGAQPPIALGVCERECLLVPA